MKKIILSSILAFICCTFVNAQVGIGTVLPDPSSIIDISSSDKGLLIPRVGLNDITDTQLDGVNTAATGLMIYNTNAAVIGGSGEGYYYFNGTIWQRLANSVAASDDDVYEEGTTNAPDNINDDKYTFGNFAIGKNTADYRLELNETTTTATRTLNLFTDNASVTIGSAIYNEVNYTGTDSIQANYNHVAGTGAGVAIGTTNRIETSGGGVKIAGFNRLVSNDNAILFGVLNKFVGTSLGSRYGIYNDFENSGTGNKYGMYNNFTTADGSIFGIYNYLSQYGVGSPTGINNSIYTSNVAKGVNNYIFQTGNNESYGGYNAMGGFTASWMFGVYNSLDNMGSGPQVGVYNNHNGTGTGTNYGIYNSISNSGSGDKYGSWTKIQTAAGGTHYGVYSEVLKPGANYAGYFLGNVSVGTTSGNNYLLPASRGSVDQVIQTDGSGNLSWVDPSSIGDNLGDHGATTTLDLNNNDITEVNSLSTRDQSNFNKIKLWNNDNQTIGLYSGMTYGFLSSFAMTFTMSPDPVRGWIFRTTADGQTDGAMSLTTDGRMTLKSDLRVDTSTLVVDATNNRVGVGTISPGYALDVVGDINTSGNVMKVGSAYNFPDYVFENYFDGYSAFNPEYELSSLEEIEIFLKQNKHLPGVQNREIIALEGWNVTEGVRINLEKIEELFLYSIEGNKKIVLLSEVNHVLQENLKGQQLLIEQQQLEIASLKSDMMEMKALLQKN